MRCDQLSQSNIIFEQTKISKYPINNKLWSAIISTKFFDENFWVFQIFSPETIDRMEIENRLENFVVESATPQGTMKINATLMNDNSLCCYTFDDNFFQSVFYFQPFISPFQWKIYLIFSWLLMLLCVKLCCWFRIPFSKRLNKSIRCEPNWWWLRWQRSISTALLLDVLGAYLLGV